MRQLVLITITFLLYLSVMAQQTVRGKVTDEKGAPVAGATVQIKGEGKGTPTASDGSFSISAATGSTLQISSINFATQEVRVTGSEVNVTLAPGAAILTEVVITAQGIARDKRSLGYATQTVKADQLADRGEQNIVTALQGKVAGVTITGASGSPGASSNINIRGITSFIGSNQPLFVLDGVPISNDVDRTNGGTLGTLGDNQPPNRALDIDINNIETVNILKGPAAAVLYGSRASAGAIIITTKKGGSVRGRADIQVNSSYAIQNVRGLPEFQNEYGQGLSGIHNPISGNSWGPRFGTTPTVANGLIQGGTAVDYQPYANNIKDFFDKGIIKENSIAVNGGDANQNYNLSIGHLDHKGIIPNSGLKRTSVRFAANQTVREKLKIGGSVTYANTAQDGVLGGNGSSATGQLINIPRSINLPALRNDYKNPDGTNKFFLANTDNPYFSAFENPLTSKLNRILGNVSFGYDVTKWLNVGYRLGVDAYTDRRTQIFAKSSATRPGGQVLEDIFHRSELNGDLTIMAKKNDLFFNGFNASAMLGHNINQRNLQNTSLQGDALTIPGYYNVNNATVFTNGSQSTTSLRRIIGYYGQFSFSYNNYAFLELTGRVDNSSTLPKDKNTYFYPSVSTGFVFTDAFKLESKILSYGKIRASIAKVGRDADPYLLESVYVAGTLGNNVASFNFPLTVGTGTLSGFSRATRIGNSALAPEFTRASEIGFNLGFFNNRVSLDMAYFDSRSTNQIVNVGIAPSTGFTTRTTNVGEMKNYGYELLLNFTAINNKFFKWDVSGNFTRIRNKVISIAPGVTSFQIPGNAFTGTIPTIVVGQPYGVIVGSKFATAPDGQYLINPSTGIFASSVANQVLADPNPDWNMGLTNTVRYKGISLSALIDFTKGGDIVSFSTGFYRARGALKETAIDRELPRIIPGVIQVADKFVPNNIQIPSQTYWQSFGLQSELNVYDATVFNIREVALSYDLPTQLSSKLHLKGLRFGLFGRNLFYYAPNVPIDPQVNTQGAGNIRGLEIQSAPNARTMGANIRIQL
ncbi:MAG TPA: SusC/RagA family TonB-linked outer membrane protein [Chitinophagaceae bacterium]|nr:SusC/RagA family TonB-linked outer membrane protein [Chitinophagaceae bacterium]